MALSSACVGWSLYNLCAHLIRLQLFSIMIWFVSWYPFPFSQLQSSDYYRRWTKNKYSLNYNVASWRCTRHFVTNYGSFMSNILSQRKTKLIGIKGITRFDWVRSGIEHLISLGAVRKCYFCNHISLESFYMTFTNRMDFLFLVEEKKLFF